MVTDSNAVFTRFLHLDLLLRPVSSQPAEICDINRGRITHPGTSGINRTIHADSCVITSGSGSIICYQLPTSRSSVSGLSARVSNAVWRVVSSSVRYAVLCRDLRDAFASDSSNKYRITCEGPEHIQGTDSSPPAPIDLS